MRSLQWVTDEIKKVVVAVKQCEESCQLTTGVFGLSEEFNSVELQVKFNHTNIHPSIQHLLHLLPPLRQSVMNSEGPSRRV